MIKQRGDLSHRTKGETRLGKAKSIHRSPPELEILSNSRIHLMGSGGDPRDPRNGRKRNEKASIDANVF